MTQHIQVGDHIVVQEGEQIHFDGRIIRGSGSTQESNLTGEPFPVPRQVGDEVYSNTTLESGEIVVEVTDAVFNSRLEELVKQSINRWERNPPIKQDSIIVQTAS